MLRVEGLETCYGDSQILFGMALEVGAGELATLLGRNGMGKTTTVRSIMGLTRPRRWCRRGARSFPT
jgi:branched-chain amino acid transport system ATP-binding protein